VRLEQCPLSARCLPGSHRGTNTGSGDAGRLRAALLLTCSQGLLKVAAQTLSKDEERLAHNARLPL